MLASVMMKVLTTSRGDTMLFTDCNMMGVNLPTTEDIQNTSIPEVFLAGPIQGTYDWQQKVIDSMKECKVIFNNPRRPVIDKTFVYDEQVAWETAHLNRSNIIVFYLANETHQLDNHSYAQTTRFELGERLAISSINGQHIILMIEDNFPGSRYYTTRIPV